MKGPKVKTDDIIGMVDVSKLVNSNPVVNKDLDELKKKKMIMLK